MADFYTRLGDFGETSIGSKRLRKDDALISAIGDIDELNSVIGLTIANLTDGHVAEILKGVQNSLFIIGAELSSVHNTAFSPKRMIGEPDIRGMEKVIDEYAGMVSPLKRFVLPGGTVGSSYMHNARAVARRAERSLAAVSSKGGINPEVLKYLNRLSSMLFVFALYINKKEGIEEENPPY